MKNMTSSNHLRLLIEEMNPQWLKKFSFITINRSYKQEVTFTYSFFQACINNYDYIINNLNNLIDNITFLYNNIVDLPKLEEQNLSKWNKVFISIVKLSIQIYSKELLAITSVLTI